jgi:hypothetical protein
MKKRGSFESHEAFLNFVREADENAKRVDIANRFQTDLTGLTFFVFCEIEKEEQVARVVWFFVAAALLFPLIILAVVL